MKEIACLIYDLDFAMPRKNMRLLRRFRMRREMLLSARNHFKDVVVSRRDFLRPRASFVF